MDKINYSVTAVDFNDKIFSLKNQASGVVKSEKFFPVFEIENKKYIFKPLSKTKPLTTPLFAYAEVFWSNVINEFFTPAPVYRLAKITNYDVPKYYEYGTLVPYMLGDGEKLVNLLEIFNDSPDPNVNIKDYVNYCLMFYDYTAILNSPVLSGYADELAFQVLLSILRADQNYHYENVSIIDGGNKRIAQPIDHEFSTFFLFPDNDKLYEKNHINFIMELVDGVIGKNISFIKNYHPQTTEKFLCSLDKFEEYLISTPDIIERSYDFRCSSFLYKAGIKRYKENDEAEAEKIENETELISIDYGKANENIRIDILRTIKLIRKIILQK